jgi:Domain of unknown function (DUF5671)
MIIGLLLVAVLLVVMIPIIRRASGERTGAASDTHGMRRFFQYLLLYGLLVVVAVGLAGLLGRVGDERSPASQDDVALARNLAFVVVGVPLYALVALWSRRRLIVEPDERASLGWVFYHAAAGLTSLATAMVALHQVLSWLIASEPQNRQALARLLVWSAVWAAHWWLHRRLVPRERSGLYHLAGSLIGLGIAAIGLVGLLGGAVWTFLFATGGDVLVVGSPWVPGLVTLLVGAPVWAFYWLLTASRDERGPFWLAYVLLAGVGGGLVVTVVAASSALHTALVWLVGEPRLTDASSHFDGVPFAASAAAVGLLMWWYHRTVLGDARTVPRTEIQRVYEYLMAGIGLVAAATGLTILVAAAAEALARTRTELLAGSAVNTLLGAATVLAVGAPVWWLYWQRAQRARELAPAVECSSPTRRTYLVLLLGLGSVTAVVATLAAVYLLFEDAVSGTVGAPTLRSMRFALGILLSTGALAAYHWAVFQGDRPFALPSGHPRVERRVFLVGPPDPDIARAVADATGFRVQAWQTRDEGNPWSLNDVVAALNAVEAGDVLLLSDGAGLRAVPVRLP